MSEISVKLEDISKFYKLYDSPKDRLKEALHPLRKKLHKEFYALTNVNLEIKKGEILGIVGMNGSGKSTMLKIISGVIQPSSGKITTNGNVSALLELGSGLHPEFTGIQNIYFSGTMMGLRSNEMEKRVEGIVSFADIGNFLNQPLKTYSSGMKARLGFAIASNMDPDILVLDEVLAVGDELFKRKCYAKMESLFKSDCTVLYVSHAASSINEICSRVILMDKGELILEGPPKFVTMNYQKYLFSKNEHKQEVRAELIQLNKDEENKRLFAENASIEEGKRISSVEREVNVNTEMEKSKQKSYFIPGFEPKSTVHSKNYDIDIYDIHISTPDREKVNVLVTDDEYILSYKVKFGEEAKNVFSNIIFKTEKGFRLGSDVAPGRDKFLEGVKKGAIFLFEWYFRCRLLEGNYYIKVAVRSSLDGEYAFLSRIDDALVFKVQKKPEKSHKGIIHLDQRAIITRLN